MKYTWVECQLQLRIFFFYFIENYLSTSISQVLPTTFYMIMDKIYLPIFLIGPKSLEHLHCFHVVFCIVMEILWLRESPPIKANCFPKRFIFLIEISHPPMIECYSLIEALDLPRKLSTINYYLWIQHNYRPACEVI